MPDWLWWLSPVLVAPLAAVAWTAWSGRSRGPEQPEDTMRAYERFRDALGTPLPQHEPPATGAPPGPPGPDAPARPAARAPCSLPSSDPSPAGSRPWPRR